MVQVKRKYPLMRLSTGSYVGYYSPEDYSRPKHQRTLWHPDEHTMWFDIEDTTGCGIPGLMPRLSKEVDTLLAGVNTPTELLLECELWLWGNRTDFPSLPPVTEQDAHHTYKYLRYILAFLGRLTDSEQFQRHPTGWSTRQSWYPQIDSIPDNFIGWNSALSINTRRCKAIKLARRIYGERWCISPDDFLNAEISAALREFLDLKWSRLSKASKNNYLHTLKALIYSTYEFDPDLSDYLVNVAIKLLDKPMSTKQQLSLAGFIVTDRGYQPDDVARYKNLLDSARTTAVQPQHHYWLHLAQAISYHYAGDHNGYLTERNTAASIHAEHHHYTWAEVYPPPTIGVHEHVELCPRCGLHATNTNRIRLDGYDEDDFE